MSGVFIFTGDYCPMFLSPVITLLHAEININQARQSLKKFLLTTDYQTVGSDCQHMGQILMEF